MQPGLQHSSRRDALRPSDDLSPRARNAVSPLEDVDRAEKPHQLFQPLEFARLRVIESGGCPPQIDSKAGHGLNRTPQSGSRQHA